MISFFTVALVDLTINSIIKGQFYYPIVKYYYINSFGGMASSLGKTPFYHAFELLFRFTTEPVFLLALVGSFWAFKNRKKTRLVIALNAYFFVFHALIPHKEYRFFYTNAVISSVLAGLFIQSYLEEKLKSVQSKKRAYTAVVFLFSIVSFYRAYKIDFREYEIPTKLEAIAGIQPDVKGLITLGWNGIYSGSNYSFYRELPYLYAFSNQNLKDQNPNPDQYNYLIVPSNYLKPCLEVIISERGGTLYKCSKVEIKNFLTAL